MINRIHSNTCGGSLYPRGARDHNRMYFCIQVDGCITGGGGGVAYKWQFTVMKITE